jgi:predicted RNase H-like HicB family nuclease
MDWNKTQAKRVCDACFGGDIHAMRKHAQRYLAKEPVEPLGQKFRSIILNRNREQWWKAALRQIDERLGSKLPRRRDEGLTYIFPVLIEQDEDGWYIGSVPSLKGCHTQARTLPELDKRMDEAIRLWLEANEERPEQNTFIGVHQLQIAT